MRFHFLLAIAILAGSSWSTPMSSQTDSAQQREVWISDLTHGALEQRDRAFSRLKASSTERDRVVLAAALAARFGRLWDEARSWTSFARVRSLATRAAELEVQRETVRKALVGVTRGDAKASAVALRSLTSLAAPESADSRVRMSDRQRALLDDLNWTLRELDGLDPDAVRRLESASQAWMALIDTEESVIDAESMSLTLGEWRRRRAYGEARLASRSSFSEGSPAPELWSSNALEARLTDRLYAADRLLHLYVLQRDGGLFQAPLQCARASGATGLTELSNRMRSLLRGAEAGDPAALSALCDSQNATAPRWAELRVLQLKSADDAPLADWILANAALFATIDRASMRFAVRTIGEERWILLGRSAP